MDFTIERVKQMLILLQEMCIRDRVGRAGVQTDVLLVDVFFMNRFGNQNTVRREHPAAKLGKDFDMPHSGGRQKLLKCFPNEMCIRDSFERIRFLLKCAVRAERIYYEKNICHTRQTARN